MNSDWPTAWAEMTRPEREGEAAPLTLFRYSCGCERLDEDPFGGGGDTVALAYPCERCTGEPGPPPAACPGCGGAIGEEEWRRLGECFRCDSNRMEGRDYE